MSAAQEDRTTGQVGDGSTAAPIRVIFADDSAALRTLARYSLSASQGFTVVAEATDGAEAIALVARHQPDCVILDVQMPRMNGFDALDVLRGRFPTIPVIMLSGFASAEAANRALAAGAMAYLDKSTQLAQLAETVRRVTATDTAPVMPTHGAEPAFASPVPPVRLMPLASSPPGQAPPTSVTPAASPSIAAISDATAPVRRSVEDDLRRFEYVVSHDLAEPLRIMGGFATLLSTRYATSLDASGQTFLAHIVDGAARMQAMIDDLLAYGRAGKAVARLQIVEVKATTTRVYESLVNRILRDGVVATTGAMTAVLADPSMLDTIVRQLVLNAITFTAAPTPIVHIEARVVGRLAMIDVHDNGIGIAPADHERVFELFQRLHTREEYPGTGTGLALVRRLLDLQGGGITLGASPYGGTVATVTLPAA